MSSGQNVLLNLVLFYKSKPNEIKTQSLLSKREIGIFMIGIKMGKL
jgi:hypothetical protein